MKSLNPESRPEMYVLFIGLDASTTRQSQKATILSITEAHFESFTIVEGDGCFRGAHEHAFLVYVATQSEQLVVNLAEDIRSSLNQEGVGYVKLGTYNRVIESD